MCTVTYLPYQKGFILTSNRDETPRRSPERISKLSTTNGAVNLFLPQDTAGGSWIVSSSSGRSACLLNGGFHKHQHQPPYRRSRGLVVLDLFEKENVTAFWDDYDWENIEPFTLIMLEGGLVYEGRWDGQRSWLTLKDAAQPHLWASSTLYDAQKRADRQRWFRRWLMDNPTFTPEDIHLFHLSGGSGDVANDLVMQRPEGVQTVSVSQIVQTEQAYQMQYDHLLDGKRDLIRLR